MTTNYAQTETTMTIAWFEVSSDKNQRVNYDTEDALVEIMNLPTDPYDEPNRYWFKQSSARALYIDDVQGHVSVGRAFTLHQVVKDRLPEVDRAGRRRDLDLEPTEGLVQTIVGLLIEDGLIGLAFTNEFKPASTQLASYIRDKRAISRRGPVIRPLIHRDTLGRLVATGELVRASLTIEAGASTILEAEGHELFESMRVALDQEPTTREIPISWFPSNTTGFAQRVVERFQPLLRNPLTRRYLKQMQGKVRVPNNRRLISINVLSDHLTESFTVQHPNPQSARISMQDVLTQLEQSHQRLQNELEDAVGADLHFQVSDEQLRLI